MKLILRYLKPFAFLVVLCLILLFGQAVCDLSLPNLMSDLVDTGIQANGVEDDLPEAISQDGMNLLCLFLNETDQQQLRQGYTYIASGSAEAADYEKHYPAVKEKSIYVLAKQDKEQQEAMADSYSRAAYGFLSYMQDRMAQSGSQSGLVDTETGVSDVNMEELYQMTAGLFQMPAGSFDQAISDASETDAFLRAQIGVTFTRLFYSELGMDLGHIQQTYIIKTGLKMLAITLLGVVATIIVGFLAARISASVAKKMRHDVFEKVSNFSGTEFDHFSTASLITRTTNDVQQVQMLVVMGIRMMCYAPIMGIGGIIMAVGKSLSLSWIIAMAVAVLLGLILVIFAIAMPKFKSLQKLVDRLNLVSRENLSGLMVIRAFGNERHEEERFDSANRDLTDTNRFVQRTMAFMMPAMMLIMNFVSLLIVWVGAKAIADSSLQIGEMMAFIQYTMQIIMSFLMIAMMFIMVPRAAVSATRIQEVLAEPLSIHDKKNPEKLGKVKGEITFRNVSFRYHKAENDVLENITFTAKSGQTTAFIGSTGSGKSTLINLIPRFYDVTEGSIEIDGVDIRDISQKELRQNIGYIPQKGVLFSGDITSNLLFGKEDAVTAELEEAIQVAQAKDFVDSTQDGLSTSIAQGGTNVSGGQKQRLSIARALVKKPPIYIFDDSFSALDFKTDAALRKALQQYTGESTVLIVAQRVSTIMHADQIIVLDSGKMVGKGTHKELLQSCSEYREIAESQLSKEELA